MQIQLRCAGNVGPTPISSSLTLYEIVYFSACRTFARQPSWSQTGPTQSNSFKLLQKITNTDGEEDENEESTEHGPRTSQQFEQAPIDQIRKMKLNENDQEFMNKIKQG